MKLVKRPEKSDYAEYYELYVGRVPDGDVIEIMRSQGAALVDCMRELPADKHDFRYAPGKWSAKEVFGHVLDIEWVFTYRALRIARGDTTPLAGVDQDVLITGARFEGRPLDSMLEEFAHVRAAGVALFASLDDEQLGRRGTASGCEFTARALVYNVAGHAEHHLGVLRERYV